MTDPNTPPAPRQTDRWLEPGPTNVQVIYASYLLGFVVGITPLIEQRYVDYHTRESWRTVVQRVDVAPEVAERAMQLAKAYGAVPKAHCAISTSTILQQLPGFEHIPRSYAPRRVMDGFGQVPGVTSKEYRSDRPDNNRHLLDAQVSEAQASGS